MYIYCILVLIKSPEPSFLGPEVIRARSIAAQPIKAEGAHQFLAHWGQAHEGPDHECPGWLIQISQDSLPDYV